MCLSMCVRVLIRFVMCLLSALRMACSKLVFSSPSSLIDAMAAEKPSGTLFLTLREHWVQAKFRDELDRDRIVEFIVTAVFDPSQYGGAASVLSKVAWWMRWHAKAGTETAATYTVAVELCCKLGDLKKANFWMNAFMTRPSIQEEPLPHLVMSHYDQEHAALLQAMGLPFGNIGSAMRLLR